MTLARVFHSSSPILVKASSPSHESSHPSTPSAWPSSSVGQVFSALSLNSNSSDSLNDKTVVQVQSMNESELQSAASGDIHTELFSSGTLKTSVNAQGKPQLEFSHKLQGEHKTATFSSEEELNCYLKGLSQGNSFWDITNTQTNTTTFKRFSKQGTETFENQNDLFAAIFKNAKVSFKAVAIDQTNQTSAYILNQSGFFSSSYEVFETQEEFANALDKKIRRHSLIQKTAAFLGAAASLATAATYYSRSNSKEEDVEGPQAILTTAAAGVVTSFVGRHLFSTIQSQIPNLVATEESAFELKKYTWDVFQNTDGTRQTVSAKQTNGLDLPQGLSLINRPIQTIGTFPLLSTYCIVQKDNYVFVGTTTGLRILDVSTPSNPVFVSFLFMSSIKSIAISGDYCYATVSNSPSYDLYIVDVSNPLAPITKSVMSLGIIPANSLVVSGNFCYAPGYTNSPVQALMKVINITNPTNATIVSTVTIPSALTLTAVAVKDDLCYIGTNGGTGSLQVFNVADPSNPVFISSLNGIGTVGNIVAKDLYCFVGTLTGLKIIDSTNSSALSITSVFASGQVATNVRCVDHYCYVTIQNNLLQKLDLNNIQNPVSSSVLPAQFGDLSISKDFLYSIDSSGLKVSSLGDSFSLTGTPSGGTQGNYSIDLTASSSSGSVTQTFQLEIKPAVTLSTAISEQKAVVGSNFVYNINAFSQITGKPLTYSIQSQSGSSIPSWLNINPSSGALSGTPQQSDTGTFSFTIKASDADGSTASTSCKLVVLNGPNFNRPVVNQLATFGNPFTFQIPDDTFMSKDGYPLTITATKNGGDLPSWLTFNPVNQTFTGTPSKTDGGSFSVALTAKDSFDTKASGSFDINVVAETAPSLKAPILQQVAQVGAKYSLPKDAYAFTSSYTDKVTYTIGSSDGGQLPGWLSVDPVTGELSGTPTRGDMNFYFDKSITIRVTAKGVQAISQTDFDINVTGYSYGKILAIVAPAFSGVVGGIFAIPKISKEYWNRFKRSKVLPVVNAAYNENFVYKIKMHQEQVQSFKALVNNRSLPGISQLPDGFYYDVDANAIIATSLLNVYNLKVLTIQILDRYERIKEEFVLKIEMPQRLSKQLHSDLSIEEVKQESDITHRGAVHPAENLSLSGYANFKEKGANTQNVVIEMVDSKAPYPKKTI